MATDGVPIRVAVLAFGQIAERLGGREHQHEATTATTVEAMVKALGLEEWIQFGLSVAMNGERCSMDTLLRDGCEVALLPPVSGG